MSVSQRCSLCDIVVPLAIIAKDLIALVDNLEFQAKQFKTLWIYNLVNNKVTNIAVELL